MVYDFLFSFDRPYEREGRLVIHMDTEGEKTGWQIWIRPIGISLKEICRQAALPVRQGCYTYGSVESGYSPEQLFQKRGDYLSDGRPTQTSVQVNGAELADRLSPMEKVCIYTGAGLSVRAGVWDYQTLHRHLGLDDLPNFIAGCRSREQAIDYDIRLFMHQLIASQPTPGHNIIHKLSSDFNCVVFTENIDNLHQQVGTHTFTRNHFKNFSHRLIGKKLLVLGVSNDHMGLVRAYRQYMPESFLFVVNINVNLPYLTGADILLQQDVQTFLRLLHDKIYET